jgi:hypothetical protein
LTDDMHDTCIEEGWNLEFRIVRQAGLAPPAGEQISANCELSASKRVDCPGLPG